MRRTRTFNGFMAREGLLEKPKRAEIMDGPMTVLPLLAALAGGEGMDFLVTKFGTMKVFITGIISEDPILNNWRIQGRIISTTYEAALKKSWNVDGKLFEGYYNLLKKRGVINIGGYWEVL